MSYMSLRTNNLENKRMDKLMHHNPFYFIRHGETDWNRRGIYMGWQDIPLNPVGIRQAELAAQALLNKGIEHIVTSPLSRAMQTARIIADVIERPVTVIESFKEYGRGIKEGKTLENIAYENSKLDGVLPEGAEKIEDFEKRIIHAFNYAIKLASCVLIVSHGGVYKAIREMQGWPLLSLNNCMIMYHKPFELPLVIHSDLP
jgi:broad specificity phosphatase PhoE